MPAKHSMGEKGEAGSVLCTRYLTEMLTETALTGSAGGCEGHTWTQEQDARQLEVQGTESLEQFTDADRVGKETLTHTEAAVWGTNTQYTVK